MSHYKLKKFDTTYILQIWVVPYVKTLAPVTQATVSVARTAFAVTKPVPLCALHARMDAIVDLLAHVMVAAVGNRLHCCVLLRSRDMYNTV